MVKNKITLFLLLIGTSLFSQQKKIENYKYIIVPKRFGFLKIDDQYQTSSLTKFLLKKNGFEVFLSGEKLPNELVQNRCLALTADILDESSLFTVKQKIELKDCFGTVLFTSQEGRSKEKDFKKSYHAAIRKAYASMSDLKYVNKPFKEPVVNKEVVKKNNVAPVKELTAVKTIAPAITTTKVANILKEPTKVKKNKEILISKNVLYAQEIKNGFQLVNTKPSVVFQVYNTKVKDVFIIKDKNGILYKNDSIWVAEFYNNGSLVIEEYQIKF